MKVPAKHSKTYLRVWAVLVAACLGSALVFATACSKNGEPAESSGAVVSLAQIEDVSSAASSVPQTRNRRQGAGKAQRNDHRAKGGSALCGIPRSPL